MGNAEGTNVRRKWNYKERVVAIIKKRRRRAETKYSALALAGKIAGIAICGYLVLTYLFGIGIVSGEGMYPRLRDGDMVIFYRLEAEQNINDIVAYSKNDTLNYGRIVALGGDSVDLSEDGQLIVNGSVQQEEVFAATSADGRATVFPVQLTQDEVFVLGDNREYALDSRDFGPITRSEIKGKVLSLLRNRGL